MIAAPTKLSFAHRYDGHFSSVPLRDDVVFQQLPGNCIHRLLRVHIILVDLHRHTIHTSRTHTEIRHSYGVSGRSERCHVPVGEHQTSKTGESVSSQIYEASTPRRESRFIGIIMYHPPPAADYRYIHDMAHPSNRVFCAISSVSWEAREPAGRSNGSRMYSRATFSGVWRGLRVVDMKRHESLPNPEN